MGDALDVLVRYGYVVVFGWVFAEQIGLPIPAVPVLLAAGALAGSGRLSLTLVLVLAALASLVSDTIWYGIGRRGGARVLGWLCRISLEPDSCVRRTENVFAPHGPRSLLFVKFVPGLGLVCVTLAGAFGLRRIRFLAWDVAGATLWAGAYMLLGFAFSSEIERATVAILHLGTAAVVILGSLFVAYLVGKYVQRQRFLRQLRIDRITPEELRRRLDAGERVAIVDLRHRVDFDADPRTLPGALRFAADELEARHQEIPRDREVVLYCT